MAPESPLPNRSDSSHSASSRGPRLLPTPTPSQRSAAPSLLQDAAQGQTLDKAPGALCAEPLLKARAGSSPAGHSGPASAVPAGSRSVFARSPSASAAAIRPTRSARPLPSLPRPAPGRSGLAIDYWAQSSPSPSSSTSCPGAATPPACVCKQDGSRHWPPGTGRPASW